MRSALGFAAALFATNLKASLALRGAFWTAAVAMVLNNAIFFTMWWIFFERFEDVRGWRLADVAALYGVVAMGFGAVTVFCGGLRDLALRIFEGGLDALMTQPKGLLLHTLGSRTWASGWGDLASGVLFIALSGLVGPRALPAAAVAVALSTTVFIASGVILHSAAFWLGRVDTLVRQLWEFLVTFSLYPSSLFGGALRLLLFTVVPAGFIGHLPVELIRDFSWPVLAFATAAAAGYAALALWVFRRGLARYESGNRIAVRA